MKLVNTVSSRLYDVMVPKEKKIARCVKFFTFICSTKMAVAFAHNLKMQKLIFLLFQVPCLNMCERNFDLYALHFKFDIDFSVVVWASPCFFYTL